MKKYEVHILKKSPSFSGSMKVDLALDVEQFLNQKASEGFEIVNVSFTYYEANELIAFVTICK